MERPITEKTTHARQKILDAASSVFAEEGFAGARVDKIADRAKVNKAMLYYHVGNKQALYTAVLMRNFDRIEAALQRESTDETSASAHLLAVISALTVLVRSNPDHPRIVLREFAAGGANLPPEVLERMMGILEFVGRLLADGTDSGELRPTDPVMTHLTIVGALLVLSAVAPIRERLAALGRRVELPDADADVASFLGDLLLHGLAASRSGENT